MSRKGRKSEAEVDGQPQAWLDREGIISGEEAGDCAASGQ